MIRGDHPANSKREGVCMYYKNCLPLKVLDTRFLHESIAFELRIGDKLCSFIFLYRSPNQSSDDFASFLDNFELTLDILAQKNPFLMVALGDFNAKSSNWYMVSQMVQNSVAFTIRVQSQPIYVQSHLICIQSS